MKRKFVSTLLALALVVIGIPSGMMADTVYAAEVLEAHTVLSDEIEGTDGVAESNETVQETFHSESGDMYAFNVTENGKVVGSDGVAYDDVVYLSADNVNALGVEGQNAYVEICDRIAEDKKAGDYIDNAVIAVDQNGNLILQREASMEVLQDSMEQLAESFLESEGALQDDEEDKEVQQLAKENEAFPAGTDIEAKTEIEDEAERIVPDDADLENGSNEAADSEPDIMETGEENSEIGVSVDETVRADAEENSTEADLTEPNSEEAPAAESAVEEIAVTEEASSEEENESAKDAPALTAENMELIGGYETEEFEVIGNAKADILIDLGYGNVGDIAQFYSILPRDDWFSSQLSDSQTRIYNACKVLGKGTNTFTISQSTPPEILDIYQAISAYIMTEPYKCDWIDTTQGTKILDYYLVDSSGKETYNKKTTVTLPKSKYYTSAIQKEANAKVLELAAQAQEYAIQKYPNSPVYGVVEYFDEWICKNNYYDKRGLLEKSDYVVEDGKLTLKLPDSKKEPYYYCHSSYGILLKGSGVCESYALAMTRLLDAVGIPNMYASGQALDANGKSLGGHAWNYIQMPNGNWYLQDSTWNDSDGIGGDGTTSLGRCFLIGDDGLHKPIGNRFVYYTKEFNFVPRSASYYEPIKESITLSEEELNLLPKKTAKLSYTSEYVANENIPKVWSSSNEKVVKVDKNGKVTAVTPGSAEVTFTAAGMTSVCKVNVHQINSITFNNGGKSSLTATGGLVGSGSTGKTEEIRLTVNQKVEKPLYTAEELEQKEVFTDFNVESSDLSVATISSQLLGNEIVLKVTPAKTGKTKITVTYGTKKATLTYSVGRMLDENWFDLEEVKKLVKDGKEYDGKALKPKVKLKSETTEKVKFKVTYLNNKDAGIASVIIAGTGAYGGELRYNINIIPLVLNIDESSIKLNTDKAAIYNGGINQTKSTIKHINAAGKKVGLKAGKDYEILYTNTDTNETTAEPKNVGTYTMVIRGKGNYAGEINGSIPTKEIHGKVWKIEPIDVVKVKVTVKVNGTNPDVTVAIGKNILTENEDYMVTFWKDKDCKNPASAFAKGTKYFVKIEGKLPNVINTKPDKPVVKNFTTKNKI